MIKLMEIDKEFYNKITDCEFGVQNLKQKNLEKFYFTNIQSFMIVNENDEKIGIIEKFDNTDFQNIVNTIILPEFRGQNFAVQAKHQLVMKLQLKHLIFYIKRDNQNSLNSIKKLPGLLKISAEMWENDFDKFLFIWHPNLNSLTFYQNDVPQLNWQIARKKSLTLRVAEVLYSKILIKTPEGDAWVNPGDFIVEDVDGNQFVSYASIFPISYNNIESCRPFSIHYKEPDLATNENFNFFMAERKTIEVNYAQVEKDFQIIEKENIQYGKAGDFIIQTPNTTHFYRIYPSIFFKTYQYDSSHVNG